MNREETRETVTPMEQRLNESYEEIERLTRENEKLKHKLKLDTELGQTVAGMLSDDYKERFKAEYLQAVIRRDKLEAMLVKHANGTLDFKPNSSMTLLKAQANVLGTYVNILSLRAEQEGIKLY